MSKGIYNDTYFKNNPEDKTLEAILYCVVLVNKLTYKRECIKIGITKGKDWRSALKRAASFKIYEARIQKIVPGKLYDIYMLEQYLHEAWADHKYAPIHKFGGHTECFELNKDIIVSIPDIPKKYTS